MQGCSICVQGIQVGKKAPQTIPQMHCHIIQLVYQAQQWIGKHITTRTLETGRGYHQLKEYGLFAL